MLKVHNCKKSAISVCRNIYGEVCNIYGADPECGNGTCGRTCLNGYEGGNCGFCSQGFYPISGLNGIVDNVTGEGVQCKCK